VGRLAEYLTVDRHMVRGPKRSTAVLLRHRVYLSGCGRCRSAGDHRSATGLPAASFCAADSALNERLQTLLAGLLAGPDDPADLTSRILARLSRAGLPEPQSSAGSRQ
jgi:hypothetical protein